MKAKAKIEKILAAIESSSDKVSRETLAETLEAELKKLDLESTELFLQYVGDAIRFMNVLDGHLDDGEIDEFGGFEGRNDPGELFDDAREELDFMFE